MASEKFIVNKEGAFYFQYDVQRFADGLYTYSLSGSTYVKSGKIHIVK